MRGEDGVEPQHGHQLPRLPPLHTHRRGQDVEVGHQAAAAHLVQYLLELETILP